MAKSIGMIPNEIIRYACLKECASILNVDEQIIQNEIKKIVQQRKDEYIEQRKKEKEQVQTGSFTSIPTPPIPEEILDEGLVPPPPFPPEEIPMPARESYIPQTGWENLPFYPKEVQLVKALIRYGEKVVCYMETEDGENVPVTVIEYISWDLNQDELSFHNPLHRKLLAEVEEKSQQENFSSERYFLSHPDPTISRLAAEMISDRYRLSKSNEQALTKDEERLHEIIPHLLIDFKLAILEEDMKQTVQQLSLPEVMSDNERVMSVMSHYKELTELLKEMAKRAGDRVVLKA